LLYYCVMSGTTTPSQLAEPSSITIDLPRDPDPKSGEYRELLEVLRRKPEKSQAWLANSLQVLEIEKQAAQSLRLIAKTIDESKSTKSWAPSYYIRTELLYSPEEDPKKWERNPDYLFFAQHGSIKAGLILRLLPQGDRRRVKELDPAWFDLLIEFFDNLTVHSQIEAWISLVSSREPENDGHKQGSSIEPENDRHQQGSYCQYPHWAGQC
jgi:hypothetical protein